MRERHWCRMRGCSDPRGCGEVREIEREVDRGIAECRGDVNRGGNRDEDLHAHRRKITHTDPNVCGSLIDRVGECRERYRGRSQRRKSGKPVRDHRRQRCAIELASNFHRGYTADAGPANPCWHPHRIDERVQCRDRSIGYGSNDAHRATRCQHIELAASVNESEWRVDPADSDAKCERELVRSDDDAGAVNG